MSRKLTKNDLFVAVYATLNGKMTDGEFATGYPLTEDLIITSRHAVDPEPGKRRAEISVKWFYDRPDNGKLPGWTSIKRADLVWTGEGDLDAALIRCQRPKYLREFPPGRLSGRMPVGGERWESMGFAAANQHGRLREPGYFGGTLRSTAQGATLFELIEDAQPEKAEQSVPESLWGGVSGMPVFVGDGIIGIVMQVPPNFNNKKLEAVPAWRLLKDDNFRKALDLDGKDKRLERATELLKRLFKRSDKVTRDLANALDPEISCSEIQECRQQVIEHLLTRTSSPERLFELALMVQEKWRDAKDRAGEQVATDLTLIILPAIHDASLVADIRRRKGDISECIIPLPTSLNTVVEIIMAGTDRRAALLRPVQSEGYFPTGEPSLPQPPESGRDPDGKQFEKDWIEHIIGAFGSDSARFDRDFREYLKQRFIQRDQRSIAEEKLRRAVAEELRYKAEEDNLTYYFIAKISPDTKVRQKQEEVLGRLKQDFPHIAFLRLADGEDLVAERRQYRKLCKLLYQRPRVGA